jgi:hypothetical protein
LVRSDIDHDLKRVIAVDWEPSDPSAWNEVDLTLAESEATPILCALRWERTIEPSRRGVAPHPLCRAAHLRSLFSPIALRQQPCEAALAGAAGFEGVLHAPLRDHNGRSFSVH